MQPTRGLGHRFDRAAAHVALLAVAAFMLGCVTPATEALIQVETDIPSERVVNVTVTVSDTQAQVTNQALWMFDAGRASGANRTASFAVVPGHGARDARINLVLDAVIVPLSPRDTTVALRRRVAFRLEPGRTLVVPIFLSVRCLGPAVGCTSVPLARCTRSVLCDEQGQTCGDQGLCTSPATQSDAGMDARIDFDAPDSCVPLCTGRNCGDDGCGGSCGTCAAPTRCDSLSGHCVCVPGCSGAACGPDGCGGSCGTCPTNFACSGSACTRTCGDPGQTCCATGTSCQSGLMCNSSRQCVGSCGSAGIACCGGSTCSPSLICMSGTCQPCPPGTNVCAGVCVNRSTDPNNCGTCGNRCSAGSSCVAGSCVCPSGQTRCGTQCVDLATDESHCGSCANTCMAGLTCCSRSCVSIYGDEANCGSCGRRCTAGMVCSGANCLACGGLYQSCCAGETCNSGYGCFFEPPGGMSCQPCGREAQSCCPGDTCLAGFTCNSTRTDIQLGCFRCGGGGDACCNGTTCNAGLSCTTIIAGTTTMCTTMSPGLPGSTCTVPADCSGNSFCRNGRCYGCGAFDYFCCPNAPGGMCNSPYGCHEIGTTANYICW